MVVNPVDKAVSVVPAADAVSGVLLVVTAAEEIAKRIESHLRNAGHPLRVNWVNNLDDVEDLLRRAPPDLLLADRDVRGVPRDRVLSLCRSLRPDLPVVLIGRQWSIEASVAALAAGAQDLTAYEDLQHLRHLELVVVREFIKHHHLRLLRKTQEKLADFESRHQQLRESTADAVGLVQEGILASANLAFAKLLGFDEPQELAGTPLIDLVDPSQQAKIKERLRAVHRGKQIGELLQLKLVGKTGNVDVNAQLILGAQDGERVIELLIRAVAPDATAVTTPALRGRGSFANALGEAPADTRTARSAMLLRIDDFEGLENRIGHADAQEINSQIVAALQNHLAPLDQLFVFSTDEIALIILRPNFEAIEQFGEFLRREIKSQIFTAHDHEAQASLSIAVFPLGAGDTADSVIKQIVAEARRLSAKGGNQLVALGATARANQNDREEARLAAQVKKALDEDRFKLAYQSIASLEGETRSHYDILLRMVDEQGEEHHASEFLPQASKFNLMRGIDRWVVATALDIISRRTNKQEPATLFVKLSEDTLRDADAFIAWLKGMTQARAMKSDEIVFEIQELVLQNHIRKAKLLTQALSEMGASVAIEHFGIGANSAQLLDHIQCGFLKFHASYTQNFGDRESQKQLMELVEVAKQRQIKTIVSHVEDANVMARLWQMGVNFIQGYHIKEPEVVSLTGDTPGRR
ncbi:MAG: cyclic di-GMP-binding protein FimX [Nevskia sp.]